MLPVGKTPLVPNRMLEKTRPGGYSCHGLIKYVIQISVEVELVMGHFLFCMFTSCLDADGEVSRSSMVGSLCMWLLSSLYSVSYSRVP